MTKTTTIIAMIAGFTLGTSETTRAQTSSTTRNDPSMFVTVSGGGQLQSRTFSETTTFTLFNEAGTVTANQTVGKGFVFDAGVGRRNLWRGISGVVGISTFHGSGGAAAIVAVPNPLFFGQPSIKTFAATDYGNLSQTDIAVNFQAVWTRPLTTKLDLSVFIGPSIIHVKQEVASPTETQNATATIQSESGTTGKAGTVGVDLSYRLNNRYSVGGFIRYAGGEVNLPSVSKLKVGGVQAAGGVRFRY